MNDKDKPAANKNTNDNAELKKPAAVKKPAEAKKPTPEKSNKPTLSSRILLFLLIFIAGMALSVYLMPTLQERLPFVANWIGASESSEVTSLSQRIDAQQAEIAMLRSRTTDLENTLAALPSESDPAIPTDLEERIAALEAIAASDETPEATSPEPVIDTSQSARIDMLLSRMSQLEASFVPLSQNMLDAGQASQERADLASETATLSEKLADLENRLLQVEQMAAKDNSGILLNLKIADLKRSFERGNTYQADIDSIEQIIGDSALAGNAVAASALTALKPNSATGAPTIELLGRQFNSLIPEMLKEEGKDPQASWVANTLSGLRNMITVRQTDGSAPTASELDNLISSIEGQLSRRNPHAAAQTADQLPDSIKSVLTPWRAELQTLIESSDAIVTLESLATESYLLEGSAASQSTETPS